MNMLLGAAAAVVLFIPATSASAQQDDRRGFIGLGIGPAAPFGTFAEPWSVTGSGGGAKPGYSSTLLNVAWRRGERFGVAGALTYHEYFIGEVDSDDWWQVAMLTIGPMYSLPLGRKTALDLKTMVGWMGTVEVTDSYANDLSAGDAIALDVRATLRYDLFRRWAVFAEGGVAAANVKLRDGTPKPVSSLISGLGVAFRPAW